MELIISGDSDNILSHWGLNKVEEKQPASLGALSIIMSQPNSPEEFDLSQRVTSLLSCCFTFFRECGILVATDAINYQYNLKEKS